MNFAHLLSGFTAALPLLMGAALYGIGHLRGSKAQATAAPQIADYESKIANALGVANNALAVATAAKALSDGHAVQLPGLNQAVGAASATAESALSALTAKGLPPGVSDAINALGDAQVERVRQGAENIATQTLASVSKSMENINLTGSLKLGGANLAQAEAVKPAEEAKPGPLAQVASALGLGGGATP